ncbi:MAG: hypothetical protein H7319_23015 [Spirosoma sp.]|nr:hypothetical protein [Spirosoma sp.]
MPTGFLFYQILSYNGKSIFLELLVIPLSGTLAQTNSSVSTRLLQLRNINTATFTQTGIHNIVRGLSGSTEPTTARQETTSGIVGNTATITHLVNARFNISQMGN